MIKHLNLSQIRPGNNDRKEFDPVKLRELADSIAEFGLLQLTTVREETPGDFVIVAGERRFRALKLLGVVSHDFNVVQLENQAASVAMLVENVSREDLDPIAEGVAYQARMDEFGWDVETLARKVGVSTIRIQFRVKLLKLSPDILNFVKSNNLPLGYAQILADGDLDVNRQRLAIRRFNGNPSPTPAWFRGVIGTLKTEQSQDSLFDLPLMSGKPASQPAPVAPRTIPTPATSQPPAVDGTPAEILAAHAEFWETAAEDWNRLGKNFKRDQCLAAAIALRQVLGIIPN